MINSSLYRMEKPYKKTKSRTMSPYNVPRSTSPCARSWNSSGHVKKPFNRSLSSRNFEQACSRYSLVQRERERRHMMQRRQFSGPDPTLPHLKYGIFRQKRDKSRNHNPKIKRSNRSVVPSYCTLDVKKDWKRSSRKVIQEPQSSILVRSVEAHYRQLSVSPSTHVDIKPQTAPIHVYTVPLNNRQSMHDGNLYNSRYETRNQHEVSKRRYNSVIFAKKLTQKY